ncbi:hypothetical protein [Streptomyces sp. NPDC015131]|uniref:hypothetical protein n=1 Tax=Streptomyces sp. NPDC015131 TaxID=3364941 RepID=UPI0036FF6E4C
MRKTFKGLTAGAALLGATVLGSGTAVAAPNWQPVGGPFYGCEKSVEHPAVPKVKFQGCLVVSDLGKAQVVLVANNFSGKPVTMSGGITSDFGDAVCNVKTLPTGTNHACYGPSAVVPDCWEWHASQGGPYGGLVALTVNGVTHEAESSTVCLNWGEPPF